MKSLRNVLIILGAPGLLFALLVIGFGVFYGDSPGLWLGISVLGAAAAFFGLRRVFSAMWLYAAALLFFVVTYPILEGLESYSREGRIRGSLSMLRQTLFENRAETGAWPQAVPWLPAKVFDLHAGHKTPLEVQMFVFPQAAYLWPPKGHGDALNVEAREAGVPDGEPLIWRWNAASIAPMFMYPGKEFSYRVTRVKDGVLVSSGVFKAPVPGGFILDSGAVVYDPSTGALFINCVHHPRQRPRDEWWKM